MGVPGVAAVPALVASEVLVAVVPSLLSVLAALVSVDVAAPSSTVSAVAFVLVPSSALPASLFVVSNRACCSALS